MQVRWNITGIMPEKQIVQVYNMYVISMPVLKKWVVHFLGHWKATS